MIKKNVLSVLTLLVFACMALFPLGVSAAEELYTAELGTIENGGTLALYYRPVENEDYVLVPEEGVPAGTRIDVASAPGSDHPDYVLQSVDVLDSNGDAAVTSPLVQGGTCSFYMPSADVIIDASFVEPKEYPVSISAIGEGNVTCTVDGQPAEMALQGQTVTITVQPSGENNNADLTLSVPDGRVVLASLQNSADPASGQWAFVMPGYDVEGSVDFMHQSLGALPAPEITGPSSVEVGETVEIELSTVEPGLSTAAQIEVQGLEFLECSTLFGTETGIVLLAGAAENPVYTYRVVGAEGTEVSFSLKDISVTPGGYLVNEIEMPSPVSWTAPVTAEGSEPAADAIEPNPDAPVSVLGEPADIQIVENNDVAEDSADRIFVLGIPVTSSSGDPAEEHTSVADIGEWIQVTNDADTMEVVSASGEPVVVDAPISTGQIIRILDSNGQAKMSAVIVVYGDVLGTGRMNIAQLVRCAQAVTGADPLSGPYLAAGKVTTGDGSVTIADLAAMSRLLLAYAAV